MRYLLLLLILSSCITSKNAPQKIAKIHSVNAAALASACALYWPGKPPVYIPGKVDTVTEVRVLIDSVEIACPPGLVDTLIVRVPGATTVRTVTVTKVDTVEVDNYAYERSALTEKLRASELSNATLTEKAAASRRAGNWWKWACIITWVFIGAGIAIKLAKPKLI